MNKNRVRGAAKTAAGSMKEATGKVTGNVGLQAKGAAEKMAGKVQTAAGKAQDRLNRPRADRAR